MEQGPVCRILGPIRECCRKQKTDTGKYLSANMLARGVSERKNYLYRKLGRHAARHLRNVEEEADLFLGISVDGGRRPAKKNRTGANSTPSTWLGRVTPPSRFLFADMSGCRGATAPRGNPNPSRIAQTPPMLAASQCVKDADGRP